MTVELLTKEGDKARVKATFTSDEVKEEFSRELKKLTKRIIVPGFRKGKAPKELLLNRISAEELAETVRDNLRESAIRQALQEFDLELRGRRVEFLDGELPVNESAFEMEFELPIIPRVVLPDYASFRVPVKKVIPTREMKDEYKNRLRERFAELVDKPGKVELGDAVTYDLKTYFADTMEEAPLSGSNILYVTGGEDNLPGYDEHLIGKGIGDEVEFNYLMPEDFSEPSVAGKKLLFRLNIKHLQLRIVPELNEDFVREHFKMDNMREFEKYLEETLIDQIEKEEERQKAIIALEQVVSRMEANVSEELIKEEVDSLISAQDRRLRHQGKSLEEVLEAENKTLEAYREELKAPALRRIKEFLAIRQIAKENEISAESREIASYASAVARRHNLSKAQLTKLLKDREFLNDLTADVLRDKVVKHLLQRITFFYEGEETPKPD